MPGFITSQKIITVVNDDETVNTAIAEQNAEGWTVVQIIISAENLILLFTKTTAT